MPRFGVIRHIRALVRKEANKLIKLVRSRVVDSNGTFGETTLNMRTSAIMEARKWLQEKRSGSKKKFEIELDSANVASPFQVDTFSYKSCQCLYVDRLSKFNKLWSPFSMLLLLNLFSDSLSSLLYGSPWLQL
ncbi:uncharacterized protein LOC110698337 isoform X1 [Chenopodium quinoa]|uniref:uncharacterized protein LOC110698337 isoform X1 n=1 Tax=Chenopodium quinoa TaxID=63459 RepID=UPI000B779A98|nr:uncharacterized protein LOC110698337 isoform X1 [Chenopodium quinoa]